MCLVLINYLLYFLTYNARPTIRPSQPTWAVGTHMSATAAHIHRRHLLLLCPVIDTWLSRGWWNNAGSLDHAKCIVICVTYCRDLAVLCLYCGACTASTAELVLQVLQSLTVYLSADRWLRDPRQTENEKSTRWYVQHTALFWYTVCQSCVCLSVCSANCVAVVCLVCYAVLLTVTAVMKPLLSTSHCGLSSLSAQINSAGIFSSNCWICGSENLLIGISVYSIYHCCCSHQQQYCLSVE